MVKVWYMKEGEGDQRLDHHYDPPQYTTLEHLKEQTNVLYYKLNPETYENDGDLDKLRKERGYSYMDVLEISTNTLPNYEEKIKSFYKEHLHTDEEIRFVVAGSGFFDVREKSDKWIRIKVEAGDLLVLPAGIYHRFTLDQTNYIKAMRLFVGEPVWTPHDRPADEMAERKEYVELQKANFVTTV